MPIRIEEMNTEVIAEAPGQLAGAEAVSQADPDAEVARLQFALAFANRIAERLAAEGFDD